MRESKGITLIALVITIIILLILAGVTILLLTQDGLIEKAEKAVDATTKAQIEEEIEFELMDIMAECSIKGENISEEIIQNELPKRLPDIEIKEDLTGSYKGYEYQIEDFKVHVLGTADNSMKIKVTPKAGTSYIKINVEASSTYGNIVEYEYIIDGEMYPSNETEYKIEELEAETNHTIKVIAIDEKGNRKESGTIKLKTEPRTYLYKEGDQCEEMTNGWTSRYADGNNPGLGRVTIEGQDNIFLETWGTWCAYECYPNQKIEFSNYTKMFVEIYDISYVPTGYATLVVGIGATYGNDIPPEMVYENVDLSINNTVCELGGFEQFKEPTLCSISVNNGASARIKNIWLEK